MILQSFWQSVLYVIADGFFWPSMAVVVMIGVFIGSVLYDGCVKEIKKMLISVFAYAFMIMSVNFTRVLPQMGTEQIIDVRKPLASIGTIFLVTIFYLLGMWLGVMTTGHAHKGKHLNLDCKEVKETK